MADHVDDLELQTYLDGELDEAEQRAIEDHLADCPACQQRAESLTALFARIESVPDEPMAVDLAPVIVDRLRSRAQAGRRLRWLGGAELLVGSLALAAVAGAGLPLPLPATETITAGLQAGWGEFMLSAQTEAIAVLVELQAGLGQLGQALRSWSSPSLPGLPLGWLWLVLALLLWAAANRILLGGGPWLKRVGRIKGADHG